MKLKKMILLQVMYEREVNEYDVVVCMKVRDEEECHDMMVTLEYTKDAFAIIKKRGFLLGIKANGEYML